MRRRNKAALLGVAAGALALYVRRRLRRRAAARAPRGGARPAGEQGVRGGGAKNAPTPGVLILVRHGATAWHEQKIFTGWADVNINARGRREMERAARVLLESGHTVDVAYTSKLKRAIRSTWILLQELDQVYRPVFKTWRLNERAYGALTGLREDRCKAAVGADTWWRWRMSLRARPPPLSADHPLAPHRERKYADVPRAELPTSESLQDCLERALPLWHERVAPDLRAGRNVLVVAHGNSLRGLVKAIDDVDPIEIERVRFAHGVPMVYKFAHCRAAPKGGAAGAAGGARVSAAEEVGLRPLPQPKAVKPLSGECLEGKDAMPSRPSHTELLERSDSEASLAGLADDPADGADEATRELSAERAVAAIVRAEVQALEHAAATQVDVMTYDDGVTITETPRVRARRWRRPRPSADTGPRQAAVDRARQLVIIRHGKTEHNKLGLFTGWQDAQLAAEGRLEAKAAGELLARHGFAFDVCYTSWLGRAMETAWICLGMLDQLWLPIVKDWRLNERMYGALTGLSKKMIKQRHGAKQFLAWRRSFATRPPPVSPFSPLYPGNDERCVARAPRASRERREIGPSDLALSLPLPQVRQVRARPAADVVDAEPHPLARARPARAPPRAAADREPARLHGAHDPVLP